MNFDLAWHGVAWPKFFRNFSCRNKHQLWIYFSRSSFRPPRPWSRIELLLVWIAESLWSKWKWKVDLFTLCCTRRKVLTDFISIRLRVAEVIGDCEESSEVDSWWQQLRLRNIHTFIHSQASQRRRWRSICPFSCYIRSTFVDSVILWLSPMRKWKKKTEKNRWKVQNDICFISVPSLLALQWLFLFVSWTGIFNFQSWIFSSFLPLDNATTFGEWTK